MSKSFAYILRVWFLLSSLTCWVTWVVYIAVLHQHFTNLSINDMGGLARIELFNEPSLKSSHRLGIICMYTLVYVYVFIYVYTYMYVCMYVSIYILATSLRDIVRADGAKKACEMDCAVSCSVLAVLLVGKSKPTWGLYEVRSGAYTNLCQTATNSSSMVDLCTNSLVHLQMQTIHWETIRQTFAVVCNL